MQITCNTSSTYHVQHVMYHMVRRDSSAAEFDKVEITFILALFFGLKPFKQWRTLTSLSKVVAVVVVLTDNNGSGK